MITVLIVCSFNLFLFSFSFCIIIIIFDMGGHIDVEEVELDCHIFGPIFFFGEFSHL